MKGFERAKDVLDDANEFLYKKKKYIIAVFLISSVVFFSLEFNFLTNWDMIVRILNANYLFHGGQYFENQRALLESFLIGVLSFAFGSYAVYAFIAVATSIFFVAVYFFAESFGVDNAVLLGFIFNPFFLFYAIKNGSELPMYAFILLFISMIKVKKPHYAGIFFALAFVSKYDSLFFLPLLLFLIDGNRIKSLKRIGIAVAFILLALIPYFAYNLILYHNIIFTFASSLYQNSGASYGNVYTYSAIVELAVLIPIAIAILLYNKKAQNLFRRKKLDITILSAAAGLALAVYILASPLYATGIGFFRFFLMVTLFATLILSLFFNKKMLLAGTLFFLISMVIAYTAVYSQPFNSGILSVQASSAKSLLYSAYSTTNCTVQSNNWVYLDYYGISATYPRGGNYSQYPIVNFGPIQNSNYSLRGNESGIYLYTYGLSQNSCRFTPVIALKNGVNQDIASSRANPEEACIMLYSRIPSTIIRNACTAITKILN